MRHYLPGKLVGLHNGLLRDLADLKKSGILDGFREVIEIGAQQLSNAFLRDREGLKRLFNLYGKKPPNLGEPTDAGILDGIERLPEKAPSSRQFWQSLGFNYRSIEFDGHRDSIALDLNRDRVPRRLRGKFHLVVNTGTTEHVANQDNAFRVIHDLTSVRGIMIHALPAGGMISHGLITYNLKFFWHLCRENNYDVLFLKNHPCGTNPIPGDVLQSNAKYGAELNQFPSIGVTDFMVSAILRKTEDVPFVTPLDVPAEIMPSVKRGVSIWRRVAAFAKRVKGRLVRMGVQFEMGIGFSASRSFARNL